MAPRWTKKKIAEFIKLRKKGMTVTEIAKKMKIKRSAAAGMLDKLEPERPRIRRKQENTARGEIKIPKSREPANKTSPVISPEDSKKRECKWPSGDPGKDDFTFCGKSSVEGKPYCAEHCGAAYVPNSKTPKHGGSNITTDNLGSPHTYKS